MANEGKQNKDLTEKMIMIFSLGDEEFGIDLGRVSELINEIEIARAPNTPDFIEGAINLRGYKIPVMDLKNRLGIRSAHKSENSRIIIVEIGRDTVGMMVDSVTETWRTSSGNSKPASSFTGNVDTGYIEEICRIMGRDIILLDLKKVFSRTKLKQLKEAADKTSV